MRWNEAQARREAVFYLIFILLRTFVLLVSALLKKKNCCKFRVLSINLNEYKRTSKEFLFSSNFLLVLWHRQTLWFDQMSDLTLKRNWFRKVQESVWFKCCWVETRELIKLTKIFYQKTANVDDRLNSTRTMLRKNCESFQCVRVCRDWFGVLNAFLSHSAKPQERRSS